MIRPWKKVVCEVDVNTQWNSSNYWSALLAPISALLLPLYLMQFLAWDDFFVRKLLNI